MESYSMVLDLNYLIRPKLINNPCASYSFINFDLFIYFFLLHIAHLDNNIVLSFLFSF